MNNAIQQIFRKFGNEYLAKYHPNSEQLKVYNSIRSCRNESLGGHIYKCECCGEQIYSYNSCNNRHCPSCQEYKKEQWLQRQEQEIINVPYFHIVFTVPIELRKLFYHNKREMYNLIIKTAAETVTDLCADKKYLGGKPGIVAILHTWSQTGGYHPHVHMLVTGGGLDENKRWVSLKNEDYFIPIKVLSSKFRGKMLSKIKKANLNFYGEIKYLNDKKELYDFLAPLYEMNWISYCDKPYKDAQGVLSYFSRYVYRVCMSNERIVKINNKTVTFSYKDREDQGKTKLKTIKGEEFIRMYLQHVLPKSFTKVRYFGFYAGRNRKRNIRLIKILTKTKESIKKILSKIELLNKIVGKNVTKCSKCQGNLVMIKTIRKKKKPPPVKIKGGIGSYA